MPDDRRGINIAQPEALTASRRPPDGPVRLQKYLAAAGVGSRRRCEELIREGRVVVDGSRQVEMGVKISPDSIVEVDGARVGGRTGNDSEYIYVMLHKPVGVISSAKDQYGRKTVVDVIGGAYSRRLYPVGRLDADTSGLILLTDDGDYTYIATHPKYEVQKAYAAVCDKPAADAQIEALRGGLALGGGFVSSPALVYQDSRNKNKLTIVIHEGKNRQVRRMAGAAGLRVLSLTRVAIGGLALDGPGGRRLASGEWREITRAEAERAFEPYKREPE